MNIYLRPLRESDASILYCWRNDPEVWIYTGSKPNRQITAEIERDWIRHALKEGTSKRFAICIEGTCEYIGNAQLTNIEHLSAQYHVFIGNKKYWRKGVATKATEMLIDYARDVLKLESICLEVNSKNIAAIKAYERNGFVVVCESEVMIKMTRSLTNCLPNRFNDRTPSHRKNISDKNRFNNVIDE